VLAALQELAGCPLLPLADGTLGTLQATSAATGTFSET
jgi:hypothetical protein